VDKYKRERSNVFYSLHKVNVTLHVKKFVNNFSNNICFYYIIVLAIIRKFGNMLATIL